MYLNELYIIKGSEVIREIRFRKGINLIVDITGTGETGNDVGKTTTLKLIDFCLGASKGNIYASTENPKDENLIVKDFLVKNGILIQLSLVDDLDDAKKEVLIERNFLSRKNAIRRVNGTEYTNDTDFEAALAAAVFDGVELSKPTFRQLISHNIRYDNVSISNTLKTLSSFTKDVEYETLHLYMLGCDIRNGEKKQELSLLLQQEVSFKSRLERYQTKNAYELSLSAIEEEIRRLNEKKSNLNINEDLEQDIQALNSTKVRISILSKKISNLSVRKDLIEEAKNKLLQDVQQIDTDQLVAIYEEASTYLPKLNKTFDDLLDYHNQMVQNKIGFVTKRLPEIESELFSYRNELDSILEEEKRITEKIATSDSFDELEKIILDLNKQYQRKGEYENTILQIQEVEDEINRLEEQLKIIEEELFSNDFERIVKQQVIEFNKFFGQISKVLYNENYGLTYKIETKKKTGKKVYKFSTFDVLNPNLSSGKKQGEISCFEIAYVLFARSENIPHLPFILNDKKELMHGNQLLKIASLVKKENIQFVCSMLEDKLPQELKCLPPSLQPQCSCVALQGCWRSIPYPSIDFTRRNTT